MSGPPIAQILRERAIYGLRTQVELEFMELMQRALAPPQLNRTSNQESRWARLPGLCCQAAGGKIEWADSLAAAWLLFYQAADIMDSVEDQDQPEAWWAENGSATAINVASGLFFTAAQMLNDLYNQEETRQNAKNVVSSFYQGFFAMCAGQQLDLVTPSPNLEQAWEIAKFKSGEFFGLATRAGAQIAIQDPELLSAYKNYGVNIGLLVQLKDDLEEIKLLGSTDEPFFPYKVRKSLPIIYAYEVLSRTEREQLNDLLDSAGERQINAEAFLQLIDGSGAVLYLAAEMENLQSQAYAALKSSDAGEPARTELEELLIDFKLIV